MLRHHADIVLYCCTTFLLLLLSAFTLADIVIRETTVILANQPESITACPGEEVLFKHRVISPERLKYAIPGWKINDCVHEITALPFTLGSYFNSSTFEYGLIIRHVLPVPDNAKVISVLYSLSLCESNPITLKVRMPNFGTPGQKENCAGWTPPGQFVLTEDIITPFRQPGMLSNSSLTIGCDTFNQVILINGETGFMPLADIIPDSLLVLVDGQSGPVSLIDLTIYVGEDKKLFIVGLPGALDESGSGFSAAYNGSKPVIEVHSQSNTTFFHCEQAQFYMENLFFHFFGNHSGSHLLQQNSGILTIQNSELLSDSRQSASIIRQQGGELRLLNTRITTPGPTAPVDSDQAVIICNSNFTCTSSNCLNQDMETTEADYYTSESFGQPENTCIIRTRHYVPPSAGTTELATSTEPVTSIESKATTEPENITQHPHSGSLPLSNALLPAATSMFLLHFLTGY